MPICKTDKYVGRDVVLEYAIGCGDAVPTGAEWKKFGSLRTKEFNLSWDSTDVTDSDSVGALRENLATFQTLTISGDGIAKSSGAGAANLIELTKHVARPDATGGQPVIWLRMTFPDLTFTAYMLVTNLSRSAAMEDAVTYTFEASATASDFGLIIEDTVTAITSVAVTPTTGDITTPGGSLQLTSTILPSNASQAVTWTSSDATKATVSSAGLVTALADGTVTITATSVADNTKTATSEVTITGQ